MNLPAPLDYDGAQRDFPKDWPWADRLCRHCFVGWHSSFTGDHCWVCGRFGRHSHQIRGMMYGRG